MNYAGYPTIEIDASKCTIPFACKKCLEVCPQAVFQTYGIKVEKGARDRPQRARLLRALCCVPGQMHRVRRLYRGLPRGCHHHHFPRDGGLAMSKYEPKLYSYELDKEMIEQLAEEFDAETVASDFAKAVEGKSGDEAEAAAETFFTDFGTRWIRKSHKLGEEFPDRTSSCCSRPSTRSMAICVSRWYHSGFSRSRISPPRTFRICRSSRTTVSAGLPTQTVQDLRAAQGDVRRRNGRFAAVPACLHDGVRGAPPRSRVDAKVEMQAEMPKDGYCQFAAIRA